MVIEFRPQALLAAAGRETPPADGLLAGQRTAGKPVATAPRPATHEDGMKNLHRLLAGAAALALLVAQAPAYAADFSRYSHPYPPAARDAPGHRGGSEKSLPSGPGKPLAPGGASGSGNATGNTGSGSCDVSDPFYPWPQRFSLNVRFLKEGENIPTAIRGGFPYALGTVHAVGASWKDAFQHSAFDA